MRFFLLKIDEIASESELNIDQEKQIMPIISVVINSNFINTFFFFTYDVHNDVYATTPFSYDVDILIPNHDDFYLNVLDWPTFDMLGFGLDLMVHFWNCGAKWLMQLQTLNIESTVTSNMNLAVGMLNGRVQIWDLKTLTKIHDMNGHMKQICGLEWNIEGNQLVSSSNLNELFFIWENRKHNPIYSLHDHTAAIQALS
nr:4932_t:CDS:2 [Entrophospora candida]